MSDKKNLNEGRIKRFIDKIFYWIMNGINNKIVDKIRSDPEVQKEIENFKEAQESLEGTLRDVAENPEDYLD